MLTSTVFHILLVMRVTRACTVLRFYCAVYLIIDLHPQGDRGFKGEKGQKGPTGLAFEGRKGAKGVKGEKGEPFQCKAMEFREDCTVTYIKGIKVCIAENVSSLNILNFFYLMSYTGVRITFMYSCHPSVTVKVLSSE